jgi:hypothetical protein
VVAPTPFASRLSVLSTLLVRGLAAVAAGSVFVDDPFTFDEGAAAVETAGC